MKKETITPDLLTESESIKQQNTKKLYEIFQIIFLFAGILLSLRDLMYSSNCLIAGFFCGMIVLILRFISQRSEILGRRVDLCLYLAGLIALVLSNLSLVQAILDLCNRMMILCNLRFDTDFSKFAVKSSAAFGSIILWMLLGAFFTTCFYRNMKKRQLYKVILLIMLCLVIGFVFGTSSMFISSFLIVFSIFSMFVHDCAPQRSFGIHFWGTHLVCLILIIVLSGVCSNYSSIRSIDTLKYTVSNKIEELRYGKDTLPKGGLSKASELFSEQKDRLSIEIDQPQELYLKGFVGGNYKNNQWLPLTADHYEDKYEGILKWLSAQKFDPLIQYSIQQKLSLKQSSNIDLTKVNVKNTGAYRKYVYLPNTMASFDTFHASEKRDWTVQSNRLFGTSDYKFQSFFYTQNLTFLNEPSFMKAPKTTGQETYAKAESVYYQFVKDSYLEIDPSLKKELKNTFFKDSKKLNFDETTTRIRQILREKIHYTKHPQNTEDTSDYITWCLNSAKEGNAISYATIAVMAYRSYGYPARYVEGYHLSKDEADQLSKNKKKTTVLTTDNAHAWVEVYRSGIGWMSVELVPGMYIETYSSQKVEGKPSYQLKSKKDKSGINTEQGKSGNQKKDNQDHEKSSVKIVVKHFITGFIVILYVLLLLYFILELQRMIRLSCWKKERKEEISILDFTKTMEQLFILSKIPGDYSHPLELRSEILLKYPQLYDMEYERVVSIIQKARFGGKNLRPHEEHTLKCFIDKISHLLWKNSNIFGKILLRYIYLIPKN